MANGVQDIFGSCCGDTSSSFEEASPSDRGGRVSFLQEPDDGVLYDAASVCRRGTDGVLRVPEVLSQVQHQYLMLLLVLAI